MITSSLRKIIQQLKSGGCFIGVLNFPAEEIVSHDNGEIALNWGHHIPIWLESKLIVEIFKNMTHSASNPTGTPPCGLPRGGFNANIRFCRQNGSFT
jgi:hypothetical protein